MTSSNSHLHHRRSIRLKGYDYTLPGAYFITLVTHQRQSLFGTILDGELELNPAGKMIAKWWDELSNKFPHVSLGTHVIMPNHFHGIIQINDDPVGSTCVSTLICVSESGEMVGRGGHIGPPLPTIIQWFKTMTTNDYIRAVKNDGWASFDRKIWQRNYYEHIIRNQAELENIWLYITENPRRWSEDQENRERSL
jgi:putative transposase